jgi:GTP-binding protein
MEIRNIAIIAHVDHGKTTLTDALMRQTGMVSDAAVTMDSNALELERGITIYSKNASLFYKGTKINIVDTPGHVDFGSEVERVLRAIDCVLLVVDAQEGPMPQTRFVLKKSLELGLKPIVVINKIDKSAADPVRTHEAVLELFMELGATDEQLDFATVYAVGREGVAKTDLVHNSKDLMPLLDTILEYVPPAPARVEASFRFQPFNLGYDNFLGRLAVGRIYEGTVKLNDQLMLKKRNGSVESGRAAKLFTFRGTKREDVNEACAGDIVMIAGFPTIDIGETLCVTPDQESLPAIQVDEPTITLNFMVNSSPFAGREGTLLTNKQLNERLRRELEVNVGLKVEFFPDRYKVSGRGELHISILLETMRREGFEIQVSQPQVILKEVDGVVHEPFEEATIDIPQEYAGLVMEKMGKRRGTMTDMRAHHGNQMRLVFEASTRGLLGYRGEFMIDTKGDGILCSRFVGYRPQTGAIEKSELGSMVSMAGGKTAAFSLDNLQTRGILYVGPSTEVYEGMVLGSVSKGVDMAVNPTRGKELSNFRSARNDDEIQLVPPFTLTIERGLELMAEDEYLEITPKTVRLRKKLLTEIDRQRAKRAAAG